MSHFDDQYDILGPKEGRYSNNPNDSGGETMWGVTAAVARRHGYTGEMRDMPRSVAKAICRADYWDWLRLDEVALLSPKIAGELFDSAINCGTSRAGKWLQTALNAFNLRGSYYADIAVDGSVGPGTIAAYQAYFRVRGKAHGREAAEAVLFRALDGQQRAFYLNLSQERQKDEDFVFGWILNRTE